MAESRVPTDCPRVGRMVRLVVAAQDHGLHTAFLARTGVVQVLDGNRSPGLGPAAICRRRRVGDAAHLLQVDEASQVHLPFRFAGLVFRDEIFRFDVAVERVLEANPRILLHLQLERADVRIETVDASCGPVFLRHCIPSVKTTMTAQQSLCRTIPHS